MSDLERDGGVDAGGWWEEGMIVPVEWRKLIGGGERKEKERRGRKCFFCLGLQKYGRRRWTSSPSPANDLGFLIRYGCLCRSTLGSSIPSFMISRQPISGGGLGPWPKRGHRVCPYPKYRRRKGTRPPPGERKGTTHSRDPDTLDRCR